MVFEHDFITYCEVCFILGKLLLFKRSSTVSTKKELNLLETIWGSVTNSVKFQRKILQSLCGQFPISLFITCHTALVFFF